MKHFTALIILFLSLSVYPRETYNFSNLSLEDGLSQITVTSIYQDKKGFMWFGTRYGLNKYDGYTFEVFITDTENNKSISDNHILCITEDNKSNLWIGTNNGLNKLDLSANKFTRYFTEPDNPQSISHNMILSLHCDNKGNLWIGTNSGLNLFDRGTNTFIRVPEVGNNPINTIAQSGEKLYLGTFSQGMIVYNIDTKQTKSYIHKSDNSNSLPHDYVKHIFIDRNENIWIGTHHHGVALLKKGADNFKIYNHQNGLTNDYVRSIAQSPEGDILIGTFNGLNIINPDTEKITQYKTYDSRQGNLSHYSVYSIYFDRARTLWIGTYAGGISYHSPYGQKFRFYDPGSEEKMIMGIMGPVQEVGNSLYIASEGGGLLQLDKQTGKYEQFRLFNDAEGAYARNILKSLYWDGEKMLCGTNIGTIYSFNPATKQFSLFYKFEGEHGIYHISRNKAGDLLIGGVNNIGLTILSKDGKIKNKFPVEGQKDISFWDVRCMKEIQSNVYLIGTRNNGLYYYNSNTQSLKNYVYNSGVDNQLPENYVSNIYKDSAGQIWIGTFGGGLCLFDIKQESFRIYNTKDGLSDNNICAIVEDNNRNLWISTISGISELNIDTKVFNNYTHSSGIKINEFTPYAGLKLSDGLIVFSGNNGFISFNPRNMSFNPYVPPIVLENLYINNEKVYPEANGILQKQLSEQKEITLNHNETNITIEYSALNYIFSNRNQYVYMLEGFDEGWNDVGSRRIAYYTNVPPGKYKFIVKGSNNDGVWNEEGTSVLINILPPLWKTWWAYTLYLLLLITITTLIIRYYNQRKKLQNDFKLEQAEAKAREEFHQARSNLFTNFSHELRTPLTLILSPLEDMVTNYEGLPEKVKEHHKLMYNNSQRMLRLVNNLMDFQKRESGTMKLKVSQGDFIEFTGSMVYLFNELAESRNINLRFLHNIASIDTWFDKNLMEKVFFNLLSNAFKNTPDDGAVTIKADIYLSEELKEIKPDWPVESESSQYILLQIEDSGTGIEASELENIFIPFYQIAQNEHSASGTGLGLSLSRSIIEMHHGIMWAESPEGEGALFKCLLPVGKDFFDEDDLIENVIANQNTSYQIEIKSQEKEVIEIDRKKIYSILVVEDNSDVRNYIISHLKADYNITEAVNGDEAIKKAINNLPDLIISDLMMPKMDGMEMTSILKSDLRTSHIPVIMITARTMPSDVKEGYETGADDYITKPFNSQILRARVDNIIRSREKLKEIYSKRFSLETLGVETTSADDKFMQKLYECLEKNISNPEFNLDDFSKEIGMSRANLYRKIKLITNLSPTEFIRNYRLEMGAKLLKEAKLPVSEVYVSVGFNSHAYFSTSFKTLYGISPTEYINKENNG